MGVSILETLRKNTYRIYTHNIYICFPVPSNPSGLYELFMVKSSPLLGREHRRHYTHMCQSFTVLHVRYLLLVCSFLLTAALRGKYQLAHFTDDMLQGHTHLLRGIFLHFLQVFLSQWKVIIFRNRNKMFSSQQITKSVTVVCSQCSLKNIYIKTMKGHIHHLISYLCLYIYISCLSNVKQMSAMW